MSEISRVLAVGAAGEFAGLVVPELSRRGVKVRGLVAKADKEAAVRAQGAAEIAVGDLRNADQVAAALAGMDAAFYIAPFALEDEAEVGKQFIQLAKAAGVRRIVFSSVINPSIVELKNHAVKLPVEGALVESGLEYTIVNPAVFFQNIAPGWKKAQETGKHVELWSNDMRFSRVDYRDVAEVAAIALTEDRLLYGTFQLCAEGILNGYELADLMTEVVGRPVKAEQGPLPPSGKVPEQLIEMMRWYDQHSLLGNPLTLRAILNRPARTLRDYLAELLER